MPTSFLNKNFKTILFFLLLIIFFYRSPYILLNGRFVAEEGSFFFRNSYLFGSLKGLTQIFWGSGYFNFWPNIATVFASFTPLNYSPLVTVYFAAIVQIYLLIFTVFSNSYFLKTNTDKTIISLIVLVGPPMVAEVWLNTLTSQSYFTIITILIFFQKDISTNIFNKLSPLILFISGLTSLLSCALSPFFLYKYLIDKSKFNFNNFIAIICTSIFQSLIFAYSKIQNLDLTGENTRFLVSFDKIVNLIYNIIIKSFFGRDLTHFLYNNILVSLNIFLLIFLIVTFFLFIIKFSFNLFKKDKLFIYLLIFFIIILFITFFGAKAEQVQGRYALIPGILLIFITYRVSQISNGILKFLSSFLIVICLLSGFYEYKSRNTYPQFLICMNCPNWKNEVSTWSEDNSYLLKIWQYPTKKMSLKK